MNVYVRELSSALARTGVECDVFTRSWSVDLPPTISIEPGFRVHHVSAGPPIPMAKEELPGVVDEFAEGVLKLMQGSDGLGPDVGLPFDAVHANYWLSGMAGHIVKHRMNLPLVCTFHTLDRVKAEASPEEVEADSPHRRAEAEAAIIRCSDTVLASCSVEAAQISELYGADPSRIRIVAPGVDHAFFGPGDRAQARRALGLPRHGPLLLFVGRIQPLKGVSVAVRTLAALTGDRPDAHLVVVGGPSGPQGDAEVARTVALVEELGLGDRVTFVPPRPHELRRRCVPGAEPVRVVRTGGSGSGGVRHPGRGLRRRGSAEPGRPRPHRLPGRGPHPRGLRGVGPSDPGRAAAGRAPQYRGRPPGAPVHLGPGRPPPPRGVRGVDRRSARRVLMTAPRR
jgi:D-inositol-3-phosphate glycosyltransferase